MLLGNYNVFNANPGRCVGGTTDPTYWMKGGLLFGWLYGEAQIPGETEKSSLFNGYLPPYNVGLPLQAGGLSAWSGVGVNHNTFYSNLAGGLNALSDYTTDGTTAVAQLTAKANLVASIINEAIGAANITGGVSASCYMEGSTSVIAFLTDGITRVDIYGHSEGSTDGVATISAGRNISCYMEGSTLAVFNMDAIAHLAGMAETETLVTAILKAKANLSADATPFTELSPENLASNVWNSIATEFNRTGTMGNKVNMASSGGIDYVALSEAVRAEMDANSEISKVTVNKVVANGDIITIYENDGVTVWKTFDLSNNGRVEL